MILSYDDIMRYLREGRLVIKPFSEELVRENGVDLRIGMEYCELRFSYGAVLDTMKPKRDISNYYRCYKLGSMDEPILIKPRRRYLLTTLEYIKLPNDLAGLCNLRSTLARLGIYIPPTVVDAGFEGQLTIEVIGSDFGVRLYPGQRFLHLVLVKLSSPSSRLYRGRYSGQVGVRLPALPL